MRCKFGVYLVSMCKKMEGERDGGREGGMHMEVCYTCTMSERVSMQL